MSSQGLRRAGPDLLRALAATLALGGALGGALGLAPAGADGPPAAPAPAPEGADPAVAADPSLGADLAAASTALMQADALRDEGRWSEAAETYWKARKANPAEFRTHQRYQEACLRAGDKLADLVKDYDALVAEYPAHPAFRLHRLRLDPAAARVGALEALAKEKAGDADVALELAAAALEAGDPALAFKVVSPLQGKLPAARAEEGLFLLLEAQMRRGELADARKRLTELVTAKPQHREGVLLLARLDLLEGHLPEAADGCRKVLAQRPLHLAATLLLSEALSRGGKREEALAALEEPLRVLKDLPDLLVPLADLSAQAETEAGFARALELYDRSLAQRPTLLSALYGRAWVFERQAKWKEAEEAYRKALAADASFLRATHSIGYCALRQGRASEAQVQFRKVLDQAPEFVPALLDLGATYDLQADYINALKQYDRVLKTKGHELNLRALVNSAFDHEQLGAFPKATEFLLRAHKAAPDDVDIQVWLGDNAYFQEKWKDAEKWYQKAIAADEKAFFAWRGLGFTLGHLKRWTDAVAALERAKALKPTDKDVLLALGDIYLAELEDLEKALKAYEEYVAAGGDDPNVPALIEDLKAQLAASK